MADTILYLSNEIFESKKFILHLTKQYLADLSAMSKESAIKVLREFQRENIIRLTEHEMEILDLEAFQRISRTG